MMDRTLLLPVDISTVDLVTASHLFIGGAALSQDLTNRSLYKSPSLFAHSVI